jgi:hypothetical protein
MADGRAEASATDKKPSAPVRGGRVRTKNLPRQQPFAIPGAQCKRVARGTALTYELVSAHQLIDLPMIENWAL